MITSRAEPCAHEYVEPFWQLYGRREFKDHLGRGAVIGSSGVLQIRYFLRHYCAEAPQLLGGSTVYRRCETLSLPLPTDGLDPYIALRSRGTSTARV